MLNDHRSCEGGALEKSNKALPWHGATSTLHCGFFGPLLARCRGRSGAPNRALPLISRLLGQLQLEVPSPTCGEIHAVHSASAVYPILSCLPDARNPACSPRPLLQSLTHSSALLLAECRTTRQQGRHAALPAHASFPEEVGRRNRQLQLHIGNFCLTRLSDAAHTDASQGGPP